MLLSYTIIIVGKICIYISPPSHCLQTENTCNVDVDECANSTLHNCYQICENTNGSFTCDCYMGYRLSIDGFMCTG